MKIFKIGIIITIILCISMLYIVYENNSSYNNSLYFIILVWFIGVGVPVMLTIRHMENNNGGELSDRYLPLSFRLERVEKICNACTIDGGKMKCNYYKNPNIVIRNCPRSKNPNGD